MTLPLVAAIVVAAIVFEAYCLVELTRAATVRYLPKWAWAAVCVVSIPLGGIVYLTLGRDRGAAAEPAGATRGPVR